MRGGSLTRYHTPSMRGGALANDLVRIAGPSILKSVGHGLQSFQDGSSLQQAMAVSGSELKRGLKRKLPAAAGMLAKAAVKRGYKKKVKRVRDILGV